MTSAKFSDFFTPPSPLPLSTFGAYLHLQYRIPATSLTASSFWLPSSQCRHLIWMVPKCNVEVDWSLEEPIFEQ